MISSYSQFLLTKNDFIFTNSGSYLIYMCPKSAQNPENQSKLVHTYSPKCPDIAISLNYCFKYFDFFLFMLKSQKLILIYFLRDCYVYTQE